MAMNQRHDVTAVTFSFVAPLHDAAEHLSGFYRRLHQAAERLNEPYEVIFVNDGSSDESGEILRRLHSEDDHVKYVELSRSFGWEAALTAGLDCSTGTAAIALDCRGDCAGELLSQLIEKWRQGYEVVYGVPAETQPPRWRRWAERAAGRLFGRSARQRPPGRPEFCLLDRRVLEALRVTRERARCIHGLLGWMGFRQAAVAYEGAAGRPPRAGRWLAGMAGAAAEAILSLSVVPLRYVGAAGLVLLAAAVIYGVVALVCWPFVGASLTANLIVLLIALVGVQLSVLGVLGEFIGRIYDEARGRPIYVVRQAVGFRSDQEEPRPETRQTAGEVVRSEPGRIRFFT